MKKTLRNLGVIFIIGILFVAAKPQYKVVEDFVETEKSICYSELNVRETPEGKVIGQLGYNNPVTLTGNCYECFLKGSMWVEIKYDGKTAWITAEALK